MTKIKIKNLGKYELKCTTKNSLIINLCRFILGDPGAVSRVDKMFLVKVYCKIETILQ